MGRGYSGNHPRFSHRQDERYDAKEESMKQAAKDKKGSPAKKYDRVVEGGNKGDKSKTKPGKKDYEGSPAKKYDKVVLGGNKGDKSKTKPGKKDYEK